LADGVDNKKWKYSALVIFGLIITIICGFFLLSVFDKKRFAPSPTPTPTPQPELSNQMLVVAPTPESVCCFDLPNANTPATPTPLPSRSPRPDSSEYNLPATAAAESGGDN
jgi:hypothetical protein